MPSRERGRCVVCDKWRVLFGAICRACGDAEDEAQQDHAIGLGIETAGAEAYQQWAARSDQWTASELQRAAEDEIIDEYIEKAYTAGFWQGAHFKPEAGS